MIATVPKMTFLYWLVALAFLKCSSTSTSSGDIEQLKQTILLHLNIKEPKDVPSKAEIPEPMKKMYELQTGYHLDTASIPVPGLHAQSANTVRSFTHMESPIDARFKGHHKFRLKFNTSAVPKTEKLMAAELQLMSESSGDGRPCEFHRVVVNDIVKPGIKGRYGPITRVIDTKLVNTGLNRTVSLNVVPAVQRWLEKPATNYGLLIVVQREDGRAAVPATLRTVALRRAAEPPPVWARRQPLLLTYTDDGRNRQRTGADMGKIRRRRASRAAHRKGDQRDPCKRRSMYVNFQDVGWSDWIVAPLGFEAFYCGGECEYPMAEHMNTTNHAIVQSLMNSARPYHVPKPCCVPTQLSSMSMLYVDSQKNVILKNYKDMVVIGCGCR